MNPPPPHTLIDTATPTPHPTLIDAAITPSPPPPPPLFISDNFSADRAGD